MRDAQFVVSTNRASLHPQDKTSTELPSRRAGGAAGTPIEGYYLEQA